MKLTQNSYTRVTLALDIVRSIKEGPYKGYHELGTVKHLIDLCDIISVENARTDAVVCDDQRVPCDGSNICLKAANLVREKYGLDRHVRVSIKKKIPVMSGLAGGSANASTMLTLLNDLWELRLGVPELVVLGRGAGMDVPYYFVGGTAFDSEAGMRLEPVATDCSFVFVLACPEFGVSTREAYAGIDYSEVGHRQDMTAQLRRALEAGSSGDAIPFMHNDFELSVLKKYPRLSEIRRELLEAGCSAAFLTGSGSTVIGLAQNKTHAEKVQKRVNCRTIISSTLSVQAV